MNDPTVGRIVHYHLAATDLPVNGLSEGDPQPAVIVRVWGTGNCALNLKVLLDGPEDKWITSVTYGDGPRQWSWPVLNKPYTEFVK